MADFHRPAEAVPRSQRSAVTNGSALLPGVDGRSAIARRYKDIAAAIESDMGGADALSEGQRQLVRRCAALSVQCEAFEARLVDGEQPTADAVDRYNALVNNLGRTLQRIGIKRVAKNVPSLKDYLAARSQGDEEEGNDVIE